MLADKNISACLQTKLTLFRKALPSIRPAILPISLIPFFAVYSIATTASVVNPEGTGMQIRVSDDNGVVLDVWATSGGTDLFPEFTEVDVTGSNVTLGGENDILFSWDVKYNPDPFLLATFTVTNLSSIDKNFSLNSIVPVSPAFPGPVYYGGSLIAGVTDTNNSGFAQVSQFDGNGIYDGLIDGASTLLLGGLSTSCTSGGGGCTNITSDTFGLAGSAVDIGDPLPLPSLLDFSLLAASGPSSNIAIDLDFNLTAGDTATFVAYFEVQPVPLPAAAWFFLSGMAGLFGARKLFI